MLTKSLTLLLILFVIIGICNITKWHFTSFPYYIMSFKDLIITKLIFLHGVITKCFGVIQDTQYNLYHCMILNFKI